MTAQVGLIGDLAIGWEQRLEAVVALVRELSQQTDPLAMRRVYAERVRRLLPVDGSVSLSRRGLSAPWYRITRSSIWKEEINPWKEKHRLPLLQEGFLADLIYGDQPALFDDLQVPEDDPAFEYLKGHRSMLAIPLYDQGVALNWVLLLRKEPGAFQPEQLPEVVWLSNLFGRATQNLVLSQQLREAYEAVDHEMKVVADIQRSLLPEQMPDIPTMAVAAYYQTAHRAGGDYYDIFPLPDNKWGLLIADVSGHGTPAAVYMAVTHSLAHSYPGSHMPPSKLLTHINRHLSALYTARADAFVTAFYAVYNPDTRELTYSSAGHNPPRLKRCQDGTLAFLDEARSLPLGIFSEETYSEATYRLVPGDQLVLYTDGIIEVQNTAGEQFGVERLDQVLENCAIGASGLLEEVLEAVKAFTGGAPAHDDRTLMVCKVR